MIKNFLVHVSLLLLLIATAAAEDIPEGVEVDGKSDMIELSREQAKREGWLPWEEWFDDEEIVNYRRVVAEMFPPLKRSGSYYFEKCQNITWMSQEKYAFYFRDWKESKIDPNVTTVVLMHSTHTNSTLWTGMQI